MQAHRVNSQDIEMKKSDAVVVRDSSGRRAFVRAGAAFLLSASTVVKAQEESIRYDCDSLGFAGEKNPEISGNDSDTGSTADRPGCGRKKPPAMTEYKKKEDGTVRVARVKA